MGLEDLALFRSIPECLVLYPCDAVSTEKAVQLAANYKHTAYIRTSRPDTPVIYKNEEHFEIGFIFQFTIFRKMQNCKKFRSSLHSNCCSRSNFA